jgi:hypothetical protein
MLILCWLMLDHFHPWEWDEDLWQIWEGRCVQCAHAFTSKIQQNGYHQQSWLDAVRLETIQFGDVFLLRSMGANLLPGLLRERWAGPKSPPSALRGRRKDCLGALWADGIGRAEVQNAGPPKGPKTCGHWVFVDYPIPPRETVLIN